MRKSKKNTSDATHLSTLATSRFRRQARREDSAQRRRAAQLTTRVTRLTTAISSRRGKFATFSSTPKKSVRSFSISDADLKAEFDQLEPKFKEAGIKIQQILLKVARKDLDAQVEQKAKDLIAKLRGPAGTGYRSRPLPKPRKGNSEDPATARNGGFLAKPFKKNPNKPHGLYDRAADMPVGRNF